MEHSGSRLRHFAEYRPFLVAIVAVLAVALLPGVSHDEQDVAAPGGPMAEPLSPGAGAPGRGGPVDDVRGDTVAGPASTDGVTASGPSAGGTGAAPAVASDVPGGDPLSAPNCDPATGRLKIPFPYAPPCLGAWSGGDNGGATSQGVTAEEIKIVALVTEGDNVEEQQQAWRDILAVWTHVFTTWGRKVNLVFKTQPSSGANLSSPDPYDETAGRALAIEIAAEKPFASLGGSRTVQRELARRGIISVCFGPPCDTADEAALAPYLWQSLEPANVEVYLNRAAEYVGKKLVGKPAVHAGDPLFQQQTRKIGLIRSAKAVPQYYEASLQQWGVQLAVDQVFDTTDPTRYAEQARVVIAKLKEAGVTTIISGGTFLGLINLTQEATAQRYYPEWVTIGSAGDDWEVFARLFDKQQWAHAFGNGSLGLGPSDLRWHSSLMDWYWGPGRPGWRDSPGTSLTQMWLLLPVMLGIYGAGPNLTPTTFRDALFSLAPMGGSVCGCIASSRLSYGQNGGLPGYDDYTGVDDVTHIWWDSTASGPDNVAGTPGAGKYRFEQGGKRYGDGSMDDVDRAFQAEGAVMSHEVTELPPADRPADYPCEGCPSQSP